MQVELELEEKQNFLVGTYTPLAEGYDSQHGCSQDLSEPPAEVSFPEPQLPVEHAPLQEHPPRPQRQTRLTHSKTKDISALSSAGVLEGGHEQVTTAGSLFPPAQAIGSSTTIPLARR